MCYDLGWCANFGGRGGLRDFWILVLLACDSDDFLIQDVAESCGQG